MTATAARPAPFAADLDTDADAAPIRTAAAGLADLIQRVGPDTVAGLILTHAQRELRSLTPGTPAAAVTGPHRLRVVG